MRLIYLHQYFTFPDSNGGTRSYDLAKSFSQKGIDVVVITTSAQFKKTFNKGWNILEKDGLKLYVFKQDYNNSMSNIERIKVFVIFVIHATMKLFSLKSDVILATSTPLTIGIPALINKWFRKTPYIFEVRDVWPEAVIAIGALKNKFTINVLRLLEKLIYQNSSFIVPLSIDMKNSIVSRFPKYQDKVKYVIENISEIDRFQKYKVSESTLTREMKEIPKGFKILYAGTFGKVNDLGYVVNLAKELLKMKSSIQFILIGEGVEKESIRSMAQDLDVLNKNVFIFPSIAKSQLAHIYSLVDMGSSFVINIEELWSNSANKFFDSLAAGRPILINHEGWQKDVIENDNVGFALPPILDNPSIEKFNNYANNYHMQQEQRLNALKKAKESYSLTIAVSKYMNILNCFKKKIDV